MLHFDEKRKLRRFLYSPLVLTTLALLVIPLGFATYNVWDKERETAVRLHEKYRELSRIQDREQFLESDIERIQSPTGVEEEIRAKFDVAKPGEEVVVIVDAPTDQQSATPLESGFWQRIARWFGF